MSTVAWRKSDAAWAAYVRDADSALERTVARLDRAAASAPRSVAPTIEEIDAIIAGAAGASSRSSRAGAHGAGCYKAAQDLAEAFFDDPWYGVAMFALIFLATKDRSPLAAISLAWRTILELVTACSLASEVATSASRRLAMVFDDTRVRLGRTGERDDEFACYLYASCSSALRVASAVVAATDVSEDSKQLVAAWTTGLADATRAYARVPSLDGLDGLNGPDEETDGRNGLHGLSGTAASLMRVEALLRTLPGAAALARQFVSDKKTAYAPQYTADVVAFVDALKSVALAALPASARAVLESAREYKTARLVFYVAIALAFSEYTSFLHALLVLESPLCARIVHAASGPSRPLAASETG
jgi:hypothetical protein